MKINKVFHYDGVLGNIYTEEATTFKVWSPTADKIELDVISVDDQELFFPMILKDRGVWQIKIDGDLAGVKYRYIVYHGESKKETIDPYAKASIGNAQYSVVIDESQLTHVYHSMKPDFSGNMTDAIIYEMHIRDITIDKASNVKNRGTYLGLTELNTMTEKGNLTGISYIKDLGVTHVQLLPIFDFGGVDELEPDVHYNWGYNPEQFFVPEGWYSTNPCDPYARINELRNMINELHKQGIRVILDVVYNHVYDEDEFPFEKLVPHYYYRYDEDGNFTDSSGCGNDVASEQYMTRKFIIDSLVYWAKEYGVDGFRFDLMGLLDIDTMNLIIDELHMVDPSILIYGEGWNMKSSLPETQRASINNNVLMPEVAHFNDKFRDKIKGKSQDLYTRGYFTGKYDLFYDIKNLLSGSCLDKYRFMNANQSINYCECHDNYTVYDKLMPLCHYDPYFAKKIARLLLSFTILAQGVPFIHAGQEFYRSKKGVENSYKSDDSINMISWNNLDENIEDVKYIKKIIQIRKTYPHFRQSLNSDILLNVDVVEIEKGIVLYTMYLNKRKMSVYFNGLNKTVKIDLRSQMKTLFVDGDDSLLFVNQVTLQPYSTNILISG